MAFFPSLQNADRVKVVNTEEAFAQVAISFPKQAEWQGRHFRYAHKNGGLIIEIRKNDRYFYWLLVDSHFKLIHASKESRLRPMQTIKDSLTPSEYHE